MTLSSDTDQSRYRVWDYPIKEQYTHIMKVKYYILRLYTNENKRPMLTKFLYLYKIKKVN